MLLIVLIFFLCFSKHHIFAYQIMNRYNRKYLDNAIHLTSTDNNCDCNEKGIADHTTKNNNLDTLTNIQKSSTFIVDINNSKVTDEEISNENIIKIVNLEATDEQCNQLCWKCLGYVYNQESNSYSDDNVFPKWKLKYPNPPDVIGVTRLYHSEVDKPIRDASINLIRSIPRDYKGSCITSLEPLGFKGFKLKELTPNKTRRAQLVNWLLFYREKLYNKSIEQLRLEREKELINKDQQSQAIQDLPSERNYQKLRLD